MQKYETQFFKRTIGKTPSFPRATSVKVNVKKTNHFYRACVCVHVMKRHTPFFCLLRMHSLWRWPLEGDNADTDARPAME